MHSVQKKDMHRSNAEQRSSAFIDEPWTSRPIAHCNDTYQGERIKKAGRGGSTSSDEVETDLEQGIWKKVSLEIIRDSSEQD